MKVLLDENLSPRLVPRLAAKGILASHVAHIGRSGLSDPALWRYAFETDQIVATLNVRDFLLLARSTEIHPGLIVLRAPNLSPAQQWQHLEPAIDLALAEAVAGGSLINRLMEILGPGDLRMSELPSGVV
jgi:predicted nuclease of predicted toxin-antitoxin system